MFTWFSYKTNNRKRICRYKNKVTELETENPLKIYDLDEILREGAWKMRQTAIKAVVASFIEKYSEIVYHNGRRTITKNGYAGT